jgi:hypothetical protein
MDYYNCDSCKKIYGTWRLGINHCDSCLKNLCPNCKLHEVRIKCDGSCYVSIDTVYDHKDIINRLKTGTTCVCDLKIRKIRTREPEDPDSYHICGSCFTYSDNRSISGWDIAYFLLEKYNDESEMLDEIKEYIDDPYLYIRRNKEIIEDMFCDDIADIIFKYIGPTRAL